MILRLALFVTVLVAAPLSAMAQTAPACDPTVNTCPGGSAGVNVDP